MDSAELPKPKSPQDIETYYQEIGRAGRDGSPSKCFVFYAPGDFRLNIFFLRDITDMTFKAHKEEMLDKMKNYLSATKCRRRVLMVHFDGKASRKLGGHADCCDNCRKRLKLNVAASDDTETTTHNYGKEAELLLELIRDCPARKNFGLTTYIMILRGSNSQRVPDWGSVHSSFGAGRDRPEGWWKEFGYQLKLQKMLNEKKIEGGYGCTVKVSAKGSKWCKKNYGSQAVLHLSPNSQMLAFERKPEKVPEPKSILPTDSSTSLSLPSTSADFQAAIPSFPSASSTLSISLPSTSADIQDAISSPSTLSISLPSTSADLQIAVSSTPSGSQSTVPAMYLPTTPSPTSYYVVEVQKKVMDAPPPPPPKDAYTLQIETQMYNDLLAFRNTIAHHAAIPPYMVASNSLLANLSTIRPSTLDNLKNIEEVTDVWLARHGSLFLKRIVEFCANNGDVAMDIPPVVTKPAEEKLTTCRLVKRSNMLSTLSYTEQLSYDMFTTKGLSVDDIAREWVLQPSTVMGHLASALEAGHFVDYRKAGLCEDVEHEIFDAIRKEPICSDISSVGAIKKVLPENYTYGEIKLTIAVMMVTTGFVKPLSISPPKSACTPSHSATTAGTKRKLPSSFNQSEGKGKWAKGKTFW